MLIIFLLNQSPSLNLKHTIDKIYFTTFLIQYTKNIVVENQCI